MSDGRFLAYALITVGGLMTLLCGTCTAVVVGGALLGIATRAPEAYVLPGVLVVAVPLGGIPTLIGALLLRAGLRRRG